MGGVFLLDLPEEVVLDILYKLPGKAICKLKCVSKGWLNVLSDPHFLKNHRDRSKKKPNLLLVREDDHKLNVSWSSIRGIDHDAFTLSVDKDKYVGFPLKKPSGCGVICFWDGKVWFNVLNPSTHELISLPPPDECAAPVVHAGFGYVAASDEYVLVYLFNDMGSYFAHDIECKILKFPDGNAESCSWELLDDVNCPLSPLCNRAEGVLVGNNFFWIACDDLESYALLDFDLESNEFNTIPLPDGLIEKSKYVNWLCVELKEELCLAEMPNDSSLDLWMLKDCRNHIWVKEYSIHYSASGYNLSPFYSWDGNVLLNVQEQGYGFANKSIQCYDSKMTSFKTITNLSFEDTIAVAFTESLFSLGNRSNKADRGDDEHDEDDSEVQEEDLG